MRLYADKAINAVNERERSEAIRSAVLQALSGFLTLPLLGDLSAIGEYEEAGMQLKLETDGNSVWGGVVEGTGETSSGGSNSDDDFDPLYLGSDEDHASTSEHVRHGEGVERVSAEADRAQGQVQIRPVGGLAGEVQGDIGGQVDGALDYRFPAFTTLA